MTTIEVVATLVPRHSYRNEEICSISAAWLERSPEKRDLFERFVSNSQIARRNFAIPLETILSLEGAQQRARLFHEAGSQLLTEVVAKAFDQSGRGAGDVRHIIFTSCSAPSIPSIDVALFDRFEFSRSTNRVPIFQHGCAGGVIGLALASRLAREDEIVLLASVELCSLVYQSNDLSGGNLVGSALFADGAAAVLVSSSTGRMSFRGASSYLIPESSHLMGYNIEDDGTHLRLDRALPQVLTEHAPGFIRRFLRSQDVDAGSVDWWLFHPGGVKVLKALEQAFSIPAERSCWAWEVLETFGNMSSASIFFVLDAFLKSGKGQPGDTVCMLGVGPGLTIEAILFQIQ